MILSSLCARNTFFQTLDDEGYVNVPKLAEKTPAQVHRGLVLAAALSVGCPPPSTVSTQAQPSWAELIQPTWCWLFVGWPRLLGPQTQLSPYFDSATGQLNSAWGPHEMPVSFETPDCPMTKTHSPHCHIGHRGDRQEMRPGRCLLAYFSPSHISSGSIGWSLGHEECENLMVWGSSARDVPRICLSRRFTLRYSAAVLPHMSLHCRIWPWCHLFLSSASLWISQAVEGGVYSRHGVKWEDLIR